MAVDTAHVSDSVEGQRATVVAIFPSSAPQGVEEELAKLALYRITDGCAAAEVVAALNGDESALRMRMSSPTFRRSIGQFDVNLKLPWQPKCVL